LSLKRKQIRKEILRILTGRTLVKDRIRFNRAEKNWGENLPAITLFFRGETIEEMDQAPRRMKRNLTLEVEIITFGADGEELSDRMDDLCEQVEQVLSVDDSLGGTADDILLRSTSDMETEAEGLKVFGAIKLNYLIEYYEHAPRDRKGQGRFDEFSVYAEYDINGEQDLDDRPFDTFTPEP
jgi:hypothetical protein